MSENFYKDMEALNKKLVKENYVEKYIGLLKENEKVSDEFYGYAEKRNEILVRNLLSPQPPEKKIENGKSRIERKEEEVRGARGDKNKSKVSIMIVRGFHTQGITEILRNKGISYVVIMPNLGMNNSTYNRKLYEKKLKEQARYLGMDIGEGEANKANVLTIMSPLTPEYEKRRVLTELILKQMEPHDFDVDYQLQQRFGIRGLIKGFDQLVELSGLDNYNFWQEYDRHYRLRRSFSLVHREPVAKYILDRAVERGLGVAFTEDEYAYAPGFLMGIWDQIIGRSGVRSAPERSSPWFIMLTERVVSKISFYDPLAREKRKFLCVRDKFARLLQKIWEKDVATAKAIIDGLFEREALLDIPFLKKNPEQAKIDEYVKILLNVACGQEVKEPSSEGARSKDAGEQIADRVVKGYGQHKPNAETSGSKSIQRPSHIGMNRRYVSLAEWGLFALAFFSLPVGCAGERKGVVPVDNTIAAPVPDTPSLPMMSMGMDQHQLNELILASQNGHLDVVQELIGAGAAVDMANNIDETALMKWSFKCGKSAYRSRSSCKYG